MRSINTNYGFTASMIAALVGFAGVAPGDSLGEDGWTRLFTEAPTASWTVAGDASLAADGGGVLVAAPGNGVLISSRHGSKSERNLMSQQRFRDMELRLEFMLARGSNAGVKMHGLYELQLYDSHAVTQPTALDCGGIYPRAVREPRYHHITEGTPPLVNAAKPPGEWQTVHIRFRGPRFDGAGNKTAPAVFEEVRINGQLVQEQAAVDLPTGAYWHLPESADGPVYLQGDHGSVAYRNVMVRPIH